MDFCLFGFFFEISFKGNSLKKIKHLFIVFNQNHNDAKAVKESNDLK